MKNLRQQTTPFSCESTSNRTSSLSSRDQTSIFHPFEFDEEFVNKFIRKFVSEKLKFISIISLIFEYFCPDMNEVFARNESILLEIFLIKLDILFIAKF